MPVTSSCQVTIEKTPRYFVMRDVASRVHTMSRDVQLIIVVRDPVTRAISDYVQGSMKRPSAQDTTGNRQYEPFENRAFVAVNKNGTPSYAVDESWGPIRVGIYERHLRQWLDYFPRDRIHFVHGERLVSDPAGQLQLVERFLGLRPFITNKHFYLNVTKGFPCLLLPTQRTATVDDDDGVILDDVVETGSRTRCLGKNKGRTHPNIRRNAVDRLRQFYRPFNEKFYQLTGIDFGWL